MKIVLIISFIVLLFVIFLLVLRSRRKCYEKIEKANKKPSLYIESKGGLGNQMFEIASGYALSKVYNMNLYVIENLNNPHDSNLKYLKSIFKDFSFVERNKIKEQTTVLVEDSMKFSNFCIQLSKNQNFILDGYLQNEKYFKTYKKDLIRCFKNNEIYQQVRKQYENLFKNSYFIHVRRGDYKKVHLHNVNLDSYYKYVLKFIKNVLHDNTSSFYVFSDEIISTNAPDYLLQKDIFFINEKEPLISLYMMSLCYKGGICANSSFSWWGSYLNENESKIVTFPNKWINTDEEVDIDIYYENSLIFPV